MSHLTERDVETQIDLCLGKIQECKSMVKQIKKRSKKAVQSGDSKVEQMCQRIIRSKEETIKRLKNKIQKMDPRAVIRIKLLRIYMDKLDETKEKRFLHKIKNMDLSPSTLTRLLVQRLEGQYANQKLCFVAMNAMAARQGGKLWGDDSRKEKTGADSTLLQNLQKPAEILLGKEGVALIKECLPSREVVESEIKSFVENPTGSMTKIGCFVKSVLDQKTQG